jgi:hypothetical protein
MEKLEISIRERPVHLSKLGTNEISGTLPLDGTGTESRESKPQEFPHDIPGKALALIYRWRHNVNVCQK